MTASQLPQAKTGSGTILRNAVVSRRKAPAEAIGHIIIRGTISMPTPVKPCEGSFSEETERVLIANIDRAQWLPHPCTDCGSHIGARFEKGRWVPDTHWPSIPARPASRLSKDSAKR